MALCYNVCAFILYDDPAISFGDRTGQSLQRPCDDRMATVQSTCNLHDLRTKIVRCPCGLPKIISRAYDQYMGPNDYLKLFGLLMISLSVPVRVSCDLPVMFIWAKILQFFKTCHSAESNKIVEATMAVNLYYDLKVSLRWLHGKGDFDIVRAS